MKRDVQALATGEFDVVVVGGGAYGACVLREAALRGLSAALVEQGDFGGATSANSLKVIHGGLRYLQQLDLPRMRESIVARRALLRGAPHLVQPLPCLMPTSRRLLRSRAAMCAALRLNDLISWDRNRHVDPACAIGRGQVISAAACRAIFPDLPPRAVTGGAVWQDARVYSTERLVLAGIASAVAAGAVAANHVRMTGFLMRGKTVSGICAQDALTGATFDVRARLVLLNTGPWTDHTLALLPERPAPVLRGLAMGMNVIVRGWPVQSHAVGLQAPPRTGSRGRLLFFVPWKGRTIAGTYYRPHDGPPEALRATDEDLDDFLADINAVLPGRRFSRGDLSLVHAGLLPSTGPVRTPGVEPTLLKHYELVDHAARDGIGGLITVLGVKYTTARDVAVRALDLALARLGRPPVRSTSAHRPLDGGDIGDVASFVAGVRAGAPAGVSPDTAMHLARHYGSHWRAVLDAAGGDASLLQPLSNAANSTAAEILHAARAEMAVTLPDLVFRRTDLGTAAPPSADVLRRCADLAGGILGWGAARKSLEIKAAEVYRWLPDVSSQSGF